METGYREGYTQGVADGLSKVNIQYTYHAHTGNAGTTANGCYTAPVYHTHISSCYSKCGGSVSVIYHDNSNNTYVLSCSKCGRESSIDKAIYWEQTNGDLVSICNQSKLSCKKTTSVIEKYTLGCGKTTETIESATIIY